MIARTLPLLVLLAATAASAAVTVRVSNISSDTFRLEVLGDPVPIRLTLPTGQEIDQWKSPDLNGTTIVTLPALGPGNNDARANSLEVTGPAGGVVELDSTGSAPTGFVGMTVSVVGRPPVQLTNSLGIWSATVELTPIKPVLVTWTPPTQNVDGTPLTDLAGFYLYYGQAQGTYPGKIKIDNAAATSWTLPPDTPLLAGQPAYFVATAFDSQTPPNESMYSNVASKVVGESLPPVFPSNLKASGDLRYAYGLSQAPGRLNLLPVGTIPDDTQCDGTYSVQTPQRLVFRVPVEAVKWPEGIPPDELAKPIVVFAECSE